MKRARKGKPIYKKSCDNCKSNDACQVFEQDDGSLNSWCFACETFEDLSENTDWEEKMKVINIETKTKVAEPNMSTVKEIEQTKVSEALPDRGIRKEVVERYKVKVDCDSQGNVTYHYYPDRKDGKLIGYEGRQVQGKRFISYGDRKGELDLWGQHECPAGKKLFITEGRCDAMALYQVLIDKRPAKYSHYEPAVVSLTRGASLAVKDLLANRTFVEKYDEVILVFDNDDAGRKATKEVLKVFPKCKVANLPLKDANDMLLAGKEKELYTACVWDADYKRQGEVVDVEDIMTFAMEKPKMGIDFPWRTVTKACFGIRPHTIHVVGAAPKIGKTDHQHQLVHHLIYKENQKVGIFDLENSPVRTAKKLASKQAKIDFTRPDVEYDDQVLHDTLVSLQGNVRFYDRGASRDWHDIRVCIEEMHLLDGINIFFIDPLTALVSRFSSGEANDKLNEICTDMADLVQMYPITIFCYSHVNPKPRGSTPHEAGAKVFSSEFTGSRAMEKWFHYGHGISRDRTDDCLPEKKNISQFYMLFDREYGQSYNCDVYFDQDTVQYLENSIW